MENNQPIIVKRVKKVAGGHHGGAWKIAFADFATAMMALSLIHISEPTRPLYISYAVFCLKKKN